MPTYSCDANTRLVASSCYLEPAIGDEERAAIKMFARIANLKAIGGTDYTSNLTKLLSDSGDWKLMSCSQRDAINTFEAVADANADGAGISTSVNTLRKLSACYLALPKETKRNVLGYLSCLIKASVKPD